LHRRIREVKLSLLIANCPRCGAKKMTFTLFNQAYVGTRYNWQNLFEVFCVCRGCDHSTTFFVSQKNLIMKTSCTKVYTSLKGPLTG